MFPLTNKVLAQCQRAKTMGDLKERIKGSKVYEDEASLEAKALYAEMVAFTTKNWSLRSHAEVQKEIDTLMKAPGFRVDD